jgi:GNAT superfamily N-acetyltransferase
VRIRRATPHDARAVAALMRAAVRAERDGPYAPETLAAWSSLPPLYHRWAMTVGGETYLVAEMGARVVGYAALRGDELTAVFVRPGASRAGLGARLVGAVEARARRACVRVLRVDAALGAVEFYTRLGFTGGRSVRVPLPDGRKLSSRRMRKRL